VVSPELRRFFFFALTISRQGDAAIRLFALSRLKSHPAVVPAKRATILNLCACISAVRGSVVNPTSCHDSFKVQHVPHFAD
jgi:hypothetical protein